MKSKKIIVASILSAVLLLFCGCGLLCWKLLDSPGNSPVVLGVFLGLGETAMESKQYGLAELIFTKALKTAEQDSDHKSDMAEALTRLGQCARRLNKPETALDCFQKASKLYEEADTVFLFSADKHIWLKCLNEYSELLREKGREKEADELADTINRVSDKLPPIEKFRQSSTEL